MMPQLTSLIDMMTILLVFLLKSFSAEGTLVTPSRDLELPLSVTRQAPRPALMVEITRQAVLVDGKTVASLEELDRADSLVVAPLHEWLTGYAALLGNGKKEREVIIQCDKACDFRYVKKVMATCARTGFSDFSLLVLQKDQTY
jgi:biopolymer transport protein ExbD